MCSLENNERRHRYRYRGGEEVSAQEDEPSVMLHTSSLYDTQDQCLARPFLKSREEMSKVYGHQYEFDSAWERILKAYTPPRPPPTHSVSASRSASAQYDPFRQKPREAFRLLEERMTDWRYKRIDLGSIKNTLRYMFFRHRKGIYVSIRDGAIRQFFAFANRKYKNPLEPALRLDPDSEKKARLVDETLDQVRPASQWGTIGCLVTGVITQKKDPADLQQQQHEPDHGYLACLHFLTHLCSTARVPDCDFFINTYDQVLLRRDMRVPFRHIVESENGKRALLTNETEQTKLENFRTSRMCPVVSFSTAEGYLDLPFVFPDDIVRVFRAYDVPKCSNPYVNMDAYEQDWAKKIPTAVFRGTATGCGWTPRENQRVRLAVISRKLAAREASKSKNKSDKNSSKSASKSKSKSKRKSDKNVVATAATAVGVSRRSPSLPLPLSRSTSSKRVSETKSATGSIRAARGEPLLDVQLTGEENVRFKKNRWTEFVTFMTPDETGAAQRPDLSLDNVAQSKYKYVIYLEGNVAAYRLCNLFAMGSVVIYVQSEYLPWIYPLMRHGENCIIVPDVDTVPDAVMWCRAHDARCREIAEEGVRLFRTAMGLRGMKTYALRMLRLLSENARRNASDDA